jgi:serine protease AprX
MRTRLVLLAMATTATVGTAAGALAPATASADEPAIVALVALEPPAGAAVLDALEGLGLDVDPLRHIPVAIVRGPEVALAAAAALPGVAGVHPDAPLELYDDDTLVSTGAASVHADLGIDGSGVTVAVVDSGIDATHPDLPYGDVVVENVKVVGEEHYLPGVALAVPGVQQTDTTSGHGTHVAGIIAGSGAASSGLHRGIAPGARLVGLGAGESTGMVTAAVAMDWVLEHADEHGIRVVNNSWGDGQIEYDPQHPLNLATRALHDAGIVVVQAAGNDGAQGPGRISRYCIPDWVVCVGASTKLGGLASLSSLGVPGDASAIPDVLAPGEYVTSARSLTAPGATANFSPVDLTDPAAPEVLDPSLWTTYTVKSGTSMATPHVSGVVALLLEANPRLTPDAVREVLRRTADVVPGCAPHACGAGTVDARAAVDLARSVHNIKKIVRTPSSFWAAEHVTVADRTMPLSVFGSAHDLVTVPVPAGAAGLSVSITWDSPVADLDLALRRPDGTTAGSSATSISQIGTTQHSETVTVDDPPSGSWVADVSGLVSAGQPYRLTATVLVPL